MNEMPSIAFILHGKVDGIETTPRTIGLSQFNEFNKQVETFVSGGEGMKLDQVHVEIREGSYVLRVLFTGGMVLAALVNDLRLMTREDVLGELDLKRAEIVRIWQSRTKNAPDLSYQIRPEGGDLSPIRIGRDSDYRIGEIQPWVSVEKYLLGQIMDMGGAQKANIHLKLDRDGKIVIVGASQGYLREQEENRLYHKVLLHVRAEQHHRTGTLRNIQLIAFVEYAPEYSDEALDRFAAKGAEAWADVPDAAQWVRELRGDRTWQPVS